MPFGVRMKREDFIKFFPEFHETDLHLKLLQVLEEELGPVQKTRTVFRDTTYQAKGYITYYFPERFMVTLVLSLARKFVKKDKYSLENIRDVWNFMVSDRIYAFKLMPNRKLLVPVEFKNFTPSQINLNGWELSLDCSKHMLTFPKDRFLDIDQMLRIARKTGLAEPTKCLVDIFRDKFIYMIDFVIAFAETLGVLPKPFRVYLMFRKWERPSNG